VAVAHGQRQLARVLDRQVDVVEAESARPARGLGRGRRGEDEVDDAEGPRQGAFLRAPG